MAKVFISGKMVRFMREIGLMAKKKEKGFGEVIL